jgi:hypothetical protein
MPGDETSQAAGFTQCSHPQPAAGLDSQRDGVVGAVTGTPPMRLDRKVDLAPGKQRHLTANAQNLPPAAPFVLKASSAGNHQPSPDGRRRQEQSRS